MSTTSVCGRELRKSTKSNSGNCVEAGSCGCHGPAIRDSKDPSGPVLEVSAPAFAAFIAAAVSGQFAS